MAFVQAAKLGPHANKLPTVRLLCETVWGTAAGMSLLCIVTRLRSRTPYLNSSLIPHTSDTNPTATVPNRRYQFGNTTLGFPTQMVMHTPLAVPICRPNGCWGCMVTINKPNLQSHTCTHTAYSHFSLTNNRSPVSYSRATKFFPIPPKSHPSLVAHTTQVALARAATYGEPTCYLPATIPHHPQTAITNGTALCPALPRHPSTRITIPTPTLANLRRKYNTIHPEQNHIMLSVVVRRELVGLAEAPG
ncbi:predicted protein [Chaetomium globosum CBS 148.51]|uniref:Uncharacterized protein n=1 Tax=Chaetomium globosum (strain ATCC 6205 / CBS 148.51 / DSM 1962 / NBRC 6347 / NRRL 1970) TaxID=306901 RepID=Q2HCH1_CHAGB|nr:uncharacterized protein CHGG_02083 [Chaetomium globosum CBS 148.51]EAQ93848.1 predicted protein [Chaetomium globosum CBS 148.51]